MGLPESAAILRVMLIEAGERDAQHLLDALRGGGHAVYSRQLVRRDEVEEALGGEQWDIVLLGCAVPGLPPDEVVDLCQRIAPGVPVILTVERGSREFPVELLESGVQDFVFKSNPARLLAVVERECAHLAGRRDAESGLLDLGEREEIAEGEARFFQLASNIPECYWLVDADSQRVTFVSAGYEQIWGRYVEALYADQLDWMKYVHPDDSARVGEAMQQHRLGGMDVRFRVLRPGEGTRWLHARNFPVHDEEGKIVSVGGVASDISCLVSDRRNSPYFAHFDALTALPNQVMFYDQARRLIALSRRREIPLGMMVIDIDRFREINQMLGQLSGNELLRQLAGRLSGSLRESDILGRLGGDVFAVLLPELANIQQVGIIARRVIDTLIQPIRIEGQDVFVTASMGIVFHPHDGQDAHELVSNALIAVRHAKTLGRNNYHVYSEGLQDGIRDRLFLETDLRNATLRNEFILYFQPKACCATGRTLGAEALIRWQHPRRGIVPPDQFIPLLEETGLIVPVGRWALETACRKAVEWRAAGLDLPSISVNLSARQLLSETLVDDVASILEKTGLPAACLDIEITESMLMQNAESAIQLLNSLKGLGVTISLDDFGTGYSSLAYLKRFPLDAVKVDRSFVQDIVADSDDVSITRAVITMAHHLKLTVVAEGVETAEQLALLISHRCDVIQGYFFSRPLPDEEMTRWLTTDKRLPAHLLRSATREPLALFVAVDGFDAAIALLARAGHRVCRLADFDEAIQWLSDNLVDVLVCGATGKDFDSQALVRRAAEMQPLCERILVVDSKEWNQAWIGELSGAGVVHRLIHLPADAVAFRKTVEEAMLRRHIADEYTRLAQEVDSAGRETMRLEEERRRLTAENAVLRQAEGLGYRILQDLVAELPWAVLCVDDAGMIVLVNDAGEKMFADRGVAHGGELAEILPEIAGLDGSGTVLVDGRALRCRCREVAVGDGRMVRLMILEEATNGRS